VRLTQAEPCHWSTTNPGGSSAWTSAGGTGQWTNVKVSQPDPKVGIATRCSALGLAIGSHLPS
jgi:hypothetical protein